MKTLNSMKNYGLALIATTLMLTVANAQVRYKHVPRVKTDAKIVEKLTVPQEKSVSTTTATYMNAEENNTVATEPTVNVDNTTVASTSEDVVVNNKTTTAVKHNKVVKNNKKTDVAPFTKKVKENSKLMDVKDLKKSLLAKWLLYMIICLIVAVIFTILAAALAYSAYVGGFYGLVIVFWIIAGLAWAGAVAFLILGLAGIMS